MDLRAAPARHFEAEADLHPFDRLNAHQRLRQTAVELAVPLRMRAQPRRQAQGHNLEDTAQGIAFFFALLDQGDHFFFRLGIGSAHGRLLGAGAGFLVGKTVQIGRDIADGANVTHDPDAERREQLLGERTHRRARDRVARAGAL